MGNINLEDQVKAANRDKLLEEAKKAKSETEKVEFDLSELKKEVDKNWFIRKDSISKIATLFVFVITFLSFFIPFVVVPAFNRDNIELATQNAITKDSLYKQGKILVNKTIALEADSINNYKLSLSLNNKENELAEAIRARKEVDSNYKAVFKLYNENSNKNSQKLNVAKKNLDRSIRIFTKLKDLGGNISGTFPFTIKDSKDKYTNIFVTLNPNNGEIPFKKGIDNFFPIVLISTADSTTFTLYASRRVKNSYADYAGKVIYGSYFVFLKSPAYKVKDNFIIDVVQSRPENSQRVEVPIIFK